MIRKTLLPSVSLLLLTIPSAAQTVVNTLHPTGGNGGFGAAVRNLGDLTGDGLPELAVGQVDTFGPATVSRVDVFRGGAGVVLYSLAEPASMSYYGWSLGRVGDLDGDGVGEFLIGAPGSPSDVSAPAFVELRSGAAGGLLSTLNGPAGSNYGASVVGLDDVNGDGVPDYAIGAPAESSVLVNAGAIFVYSGQNGALLYSVSGNAASEELGRSMAAMADRNSDGAPEILVGAPGVNQAYIFSGVNGALLQTFTGPAVTQSFGFSVAEVADIDGDTFADVMIGSPEENDSFGANAGAARVYSSQSASLIYEFLGGFAGDFHGYSVSGLGDIDHDGVGDLLIGAPLISSSSFFPAGFIQARSGLTGASLFFVSGGQLGAMLGFAVDDLGDFTGNGLRDIAAGAPGAEFVFVVQAEDTVGTLFCFGDGVGSTCPCGNNNDGSVGLGQAGCANGVSSGGAQMLASGSTSLSAGTLHLFGTGLEPLATGLYFQGTSPVNGGLGSILGDGFLCAGGNILRMEIVSADAQGTSETSIDIGAVSGAQAGDVRSYQLWYRNPTSSPCSTGFNLTNAVELQWAP